MKIKAKGKEKGGRRKEGKSKKGKREKSGKRSRRSELASGVKIKTKANYSIPAGIFSDFHDIFSCLVLHRGVLSRRYFLLRETHFAALRLYSFADIRSEFIRCISG